MTTIVIDGLNEEDFRRSIENRLREGSAGAAIDRLRGLIAPYAGPGGLLPERLLTVTAADLHLSGWDALGDAIRRRDMPGRRVTALSIAFGWPGEKLPHPDAAGHLKPHLETSYFSDNAFPFSQSARDDLLEGYSFYGCTWSGDCEASDTALSLDGIDDLHGALALLEARLLTSDEPDEDGIRAGSLGACLLSALLVQAVGERVARDALPRPLCVMAGSSGVYPYFDAPVAGMPDLPRRPAEAEIDEVQGGAPAPRYSSLLMTGIPRAKKRAVLVLDESDGETSQRIARLRGLNHADDRDEAAQAEAIPVPEMPELAAAAAAGGPLLAKKPAKRTGNLYDMFGLPQPAPPAAESALAEWATPAKAADGDDAPLGPGFTMLEPDLQQRLHSLLSAEAPTVAEAPRPLPPMPVGAEAPVSLAARENEPAAKPATASPQPVPERLRVRLHRKIRALLARFGL